MSARDLAEAVCEAVRPVPVDVADQPTARGARRARMTADKARAELGWQPVVAFHEGLWSFAQWLAYEADPHAS
jgi:nucleoside-diphosphate-sugar epimerase